jgi:uncharacterized protein YyaL (SSP411 family)
VLSRLHLLTGEARYRERAEQLLGALSGEAARNPAVHAALLGNTLWLDQPVQVGGGGALGEPDCEAQRRAALAAAPAAATLLTVASGASLPAGHPAAGKTQLEGGATAYVCRGQTCSLPLAGPDRLAAALAPGSVREGF